MSERSIGHLFVTVQVVLLVALVLVPDGDAWSRPAVLRIVAGAMVGLGVGIALVAALGLGRSLTATPEPKAEGVLRTGGLQALVRHPIYTGVMLLVIGVTIRSGSIFGLVVGAVLIFFFNVKARWEEQRLTAHYPDYPAYAARTPRFIPSLRSLR